MSRISRYYDDLETNGDGGKMWGGGGVRLKPQNTRYQSDVLVNHGVRWSREGKKGKPTYDERFELGTSSG